MGLFASPAQSKEMVKQFSFDELTTNKIIKLSDYQGKVILLVNLASKCGFTTQYKGLESIYQKYKAKGLVIIGVPSNDFGTQEPGTNEQIARFAKLNYAVSFPMTKKYSIKGENAHPFYRYVKNKLGLSAAPKWNFHKYLINRKGEVIDYFYSTTKPDSVRLIKAIETALESNENL